MLTFPLKKEEYEKIKSGKKTIKYLAVKPYWTKRIATSLCRPMFALYSPKELFSKVSAVGFKRKFASCYPANACLLRLGYTRKKMTAYISLIEVVDGKDTDLHIDKPVYAIHLANVKEVWEDNMTRRELNYYNYEIVFENSFILAKKCRLRR